MTRFTDRVTRDLGQIADRATPSPTAWESIQHRIDEQADPSTMEVIMLSPDRNDSPKRGWMLAAAAGVIILIGGLVFATTRSDDDTVPADTPQATLPAEPAPDARGRSRRRSCRRAGPRADHRRRGGAGTGARANT